MNRITHGIVLVTALCIPMSVLAEKDQKHPWEQRYSPYDLMERDLTREEILMSDRWDACQSMVSGTTIATGALYEEKTVIETNPGYDAFEVISIAFDVNVDGYESALNKKILELAKQYFGSWQKNGENLELKQTAWRWCIQLEPSLFEY